MHLQCMAASPALSVGARVGGAAQTFEINTEWKGEESEVVLLASNVSPTVSFQNASSDERSMFHGN